MLKKRSVFHVPVCISLVIHVSSGRTTGSLLCLIIPVKVFVTLKPFSTLYFVLLTLGDPIRQLLWQRRLKKRPGPATGRSSPVWVCVCVCVFSPDTQAVEQGGRWWWRVSSPALWWRSSLSSLIAHRPEKWQKTTE